MTSPLRRYISAFPRCTVTDSSCIVQRTNSSLGKRPLSAAMSPRRFTNSPSVCMSLTNVNRIDRPLHVPAAASSAVVVHGE